MGINATAGKFEKMLEEEVRKVKGNVSPVRTPFLRRLLTKYLRCNQIHPNPDDEFCVPSVGPNYEIISGYMQTISYGRKQGEHKFFEQPVLVEKITPDGYMLLNGHHRWAAAIKAGLPEIRVKIVNLTQQNDLSKMLARAKNTKRVVLDLDEVVYRKEFGEMTEKPLPFPFGRLYRDPMRLGIPALFNSLGDRGYDIWVYTARYDSFESVLQYFHLHHTRVCGVVTGMKRKTGAFAVFREQMEKMIRETACSKR